MRYEHSACREQHLTGRRGFGSLHPWPSAHGRCTPSSRTVPSAGDSPGCPSPSDGLQGRHITLLKSIIIYLYNKRCVSVLSAKEASLTIIRTSYPIPLYLIPTYCKLYKYLIIYFTAVRCSRLRLVRNCERIKAEKATLS